MKLTAQEFAVLHDALTDAFPTYDALGLLMAKAGQNIGNVAAPGPTPTVAMNVIQYAEANDWVANLIGAARATNPNNRKLLGLAEAVGLEPSSVGVSESEAEMALPKVTAHLERYTDPERGISDLGSLSYRKLEFMRQICRIEMGGPVGTGFLIGPRTVMTNYHVIKPALDNKFDPADIVLRFDFQRLRDGITTNAGTTTKLATEWLVDFEPFSEVDLKKYDEANLPDANQLDYAVLRTAQEVGLEKSSGAIELERGWVEPVGYEYEFALNTYLMVVQHPCDEPISYDDPDDAVVRVNPNGTRVHYRSNTLPGSSGSPVFNKDLELVALHHSGEPPDPDWFKPCKEKTTPGEYNAGIPIRRIQSHLATKGNDWAFGSTGP